MASSTSLYVGDLHPDVTDGQLFDTFNEFKSLTSVRVCRDSSTRRSLCYGYVNFISSQDAIQAIETKNHMVLNGKAIRVMWSHRDPDARRYGVGNVYVKNLDEMIDSAKLQEIFSKFGHISSCKVVTSEDGKSMGYGYVQFTSNDSAEDAIHKLNGTNIEGKQIYVSKFVRKADRSLPTTNVQYTNLYFKNLDPDITEEVVQNKFSSFGKIVSLVIYKDDNGTSKGFGFVNFENPDDARQAMEAMHGSQLGLKILYVARAQKKVEREQILRCQFEEKKKERIIKYMDSNVYIKNIDDQVTDEKLCELFSKCGNITSAKLMRNDKGISKGFGFACFSTPDEAITAVNSFHRYMFYGKPLYVAIAQKKEERQAQLQLQYSQSQCMDRLPSSLITEGYPHFYYTTAPSVVSHQGFIYQPIGIRPPTWQGNAFPPTPQQLSQSSLVNSLPNNTRPKRQNRVKTTDQVPQENKIPTKFVVLPKDSTNQQKSTQLQYLANGKHEVSKTSSIFSARSNISKLEGIENLSGMLVAATPQKQKQILGERLYPLVHNHKPELAAKITGMLLEMDNSELLLLIESSDSLITKVEEAVQVLKLSRAKIPNQDKIHANFLSTEVAVN